MASRPSWQRVSEIFDEALERPATERNTWLAQACGDDTALRREVEQLLAAHEHARGVLEQPVEALAQGALGEAPEGSRHPRVGPYRIVAEIGRGGMGVVYKAEDPRLGRFVALKFLPPSLTSNERAKERLLAEARAISRLDHPNICTVHDIGQTEEGQLFFAMAFYEGRTLAERIERGPLRFKEALAIAIQVASGLHHAHEAGVIHRDIKPSNVFLMAGGEAKILDFGLAKRDLTPQSDPGMRIGTVSYMSPEQALGKEVDPRTDLWSLGVTLYEMLSGRKPFSGEYEPAVLYEIANEDPAPPSTWHTDLPRGLDRIVLKALEKDRDRRYQRAQDFLADLRREKKSIESGVAAAPAAPSIAVLPFMSKNRDEESEFLSDGITEDITSALTNVEGLRVAAYHAALQFKGKTPDLQEVGRRLRVDSVLVGSVRRAGKRLRITVRLSDVAAGSEIWSERYDRVLEDIFDIQDEIAQAIAAKLKGQLPATAPAVSPPSGHPATSPASPSARDLRESLASGAAREAARLAESPAPAAAFGEPSAQFAASAAQPPRPAVRNLPSYLTSFVGREQEIREVRRLLDSARLLTLTGPGGAGKTRLSQRVATEVEPLFADGVSFVPLAPISDPALVSSAVARALDVPESPGSPILANLKSALQPKCALLVLDNFEQVLEAAPAVAELLSACARLKIIVTSRAPLQISGEQEFPVPPLALPRTGKSVNPETLGRHSAVKLFVDRAQAACPDFDLSNKNAQQVAELCIRLDGLPLAIELAAARVKLFSPKTLITRLAQRLDLRGATRDQPERHRTLRQAIAWSYDLLDEPAQHFFRRLSVFAGGWTLEAAEALCSGDSAVEGRAFDLLTALADHSLVRRLEAADGEPHFLMLETIRDFGLECLKQANEEEAVRRLHAEYFLALADKAEPELTGSEQARWLDCLESEHDNLRAVFAWAQQSGEATFGLRLGAALWRFWIARGHTHEGLQRLDAFLAHPPAKDAFDARVRALNGLGTLCHYHGDLLKARAVLEECLELARSRNDKKGVAKALTNLAWVHSELSELASARALSEEALALQEELGEKRGTALALNNLGWVANYIGDYREARSFHERSLAIRREIGDQRGMAFALSNLAWAEQYHGDYEKAAALLAEAMTILRPVHDRVLLGWTFINRGQLARELGQLERAIRILEDGLALWPWGGHPTLLAWTQTSLGAALHECGETERAEAAFSKGLHAWKEVHCPWGVAQNLYEQSRAAIRQQDPNATSLLRESLKIRGEIGDRRGVAECLEALAEAAFTRSHPERSLVLFAAAEALREKLDTPVSPRRRAEIERCLQPLQSARNPERLEKARRRGRAFSLDDALALALRPKGSEVKE